MANQKNGNTIRTKIINNWFYGSVEDRLTAQRTSEIYNSSARQIENMLITDLGTLKVAKKFNETSITVVGDIRKCLNTSENYYLLLTTENLYLMNKDTNVVVNYVAHGLQSTVDMVIMARNSLVLYDTINPVQKYILSNDNAVKADVLKILNPIKDKKKLQLDLWRISTDPINASKKRAVKMTGTSSIDEPIIKIKNNLIYLSNSDIQIKRIYTNYNEIVDINYFDKPVSGDIYGVLKDYYEVKGDNTYLVGNEEVTIGSTTPDTTYGGVYFDKINGADTNGAFSYGEMVHISSPDKIGFHQDRLIFHKDGYLYFSKMRDYFNFRNDTKENEDPFYIQLAPINNRRGNLRDFISSDGLFVISDVGIYVIGYGGFQITPVNVGAGTYVATSMSVGTEYELVDGILYFLNNSGVLKSVYVDRSSEQTVFLSPTVDKYSVNKTYKYLSNFTIEDKNYLVAFTGKDDKMFLFEPVNYQGIFRRTHLVFEGEQENLFSIGDKLITKDIIYVEGDNNYGIATIRINPIALDGNSILCDNSSSIVSVATKLINENRLGILGLEINGDKVHNLGSHVDDLYNIYKLKCKFNVKTGFDIKIHTKKNNSIVELQAIQLNYVVVEDR